MLADVKLIKLNFCGFQKILFEKGLFEKYLFRNYFLQWQNNFCCMLLNFR